MFSLVKDAVEQELEVEIHRLVTDLLRHILQAFSFLLTDDEKKEVQDTILKLRVQFGANNKIFNRKIKETQKVVKIVAGKYPGFFKSAEVNLLCGVEIKFE
jgi:hypothetical protein